MDSTELNLTIKSADELESLKILNEEIDTVIEQVREKPRCDFYYVLMSEDGLYFESWYSTEKQMGASGGGCRLTGVLMAADKWTCEEMAKVHKQELSRDYGSDEISNAKVWKVHSPIIECCEV